MASESRQRTDPLISDLISESHRFGYFQALRVLQRQLEQRHGIESAREQMELGTVLQIRPNISMGCPASDLDTIELIDPVDALDERERYRITVNFLGLYGVDSPLPDYYLEDFVHADEEDNPQRQFLDVFHHRIYWLLYQSWQKYRYYIEYRNDANDRFSRRFFSLIGLNTERSRRDLGFKSQKLLPYLGVLSRRACSAKTIERVLRKLLKIPVKLQEFIPSRVTVSEDQQNRLGMRNCTLGRDITLGSQLLHVGNAFRVKIGPVDWDTFHSLLRGGESRHVLNSAIGQMLHKPLDYDLDMSMQPDSRRQFSIGEKNECGLGRSTWLNADPTATSTALFMDD